MKEGGPAGPPFFRCSSADGVLSKQHTMEDLMNRYMLLALLPLAACSGTARSEGTPPSGAGGNRTFAVNGFTSVDAAGPDDVDVRVGSGFSVRAEGDSKILDKLEIVKEGDTLKVRRKQHSGFS